MCPFVSLGSTYSCVFVCLSVSVCVGIRLSVCRVGKKEGGRRKENENRDDKWDER